MGGSTQRVTCALDRFRGRPQGAAPTNECVLLVVGAGLRACPVLGTYKGCPYEMTNMRVGAGLVPAFLLPIITITTKCEKRRMM